MPSIFRYKNAAKTYFKKAHYDWQIDSRWPNEGLHAPHVGRFNNMFRWPTDEEKLESRLLRMSFRLHCWETIAARRDNWDGWQLRLKAPGKISGRK
jgi:hypothetical protein